MGGRNLLQEAPSPWRADQSSDTDDASLGGQNPPHRATCVNTRSKRLSAITTDEDSGRALSLPTSDSCHVARTRFQKKNSLATIESIEKRFEIQRSLPFPPPRH